MHSKEISQIHEGLLHQWQLDTMAQIQTRLKQLIYSLMLGLGRMYIKRNTVLLIFLLPLSQQPLSTNTGVRVLS